MTEAGEPIDAAQEPEGALAVFRNPSFLRLWLSQASTQIGGNMVLFGLTVVVSATQPNTAVSLLILSFLVPAVLFSAVAGVYVDRVDRRLVLIATNVVRGISMIALFLVGDHFLLILLLNIFVSTVTVFFAPAEAAMIPEVVPRSQLLAANGVFTLTLNAAFALGFALLGPLVINIAGPQAVILIVAALYFLASVFCFTLPPSPPPPRAPTDTGAHPVGATSEAIRSTVAQLKEGLSFIRYNRSIGWSLLYLGITASLVGVLGVLGPDFAETALGLEPKDFAVIVLPLGGGIVMGILLLNSYGQYLPRRRVIEGGLILLGVMLALLSVAGPISRVLQNADTASSLVDLSALTSLLAIVVFIAFVAGVAYGGVAIPAQTQLQEDLPEEVRGRVFGILNMLVSVSSFLPIIVVG
ncbi:MAG: MFS transporter, partial [Chloroflexi bacterium]|nr:MFS transporter [Chloroflexota bacterium]